MDNCFCYICLFVSFFIFCTFCIWMGEHYYYALGLHTLFSMVTLLLVQAWHLVYQSLWFSPFILLFNIRRIACGKRYHVTLGWNYFDFTSVPFSVGDGERVKTFHTFKICVDFQAGNYRGSLISWDYIRVGQLLWPKGLIGCWVLTAGSDVAANLPASLMRIVILYILYKIIIMLTLLEYIDIL